MPCALSYLFIVAPLSNQLQPKGACIKMPFGIGSYTAMAYPTNFNFGM